MVPKMAFSICKLTLYCDGTEVQLQVACKIANVAGHGPGPRNWGPGLGNVRQIKGPLEGFMLIQKNEISLPKKHRVPGSPAGEPPPNSFSVYPKKIQKSYFFLIV